MEEMEQNGTESQSSGEQSYESSGGQPLSDVIQNESTIPSTNVEEIIDLEKYKKFKFDGKDTTLDDLRNGYLRHSDYTKKTQEISQERKYYDNLSYDLERVKANPSLADKFRELYPEKFHGYLNYVTQMANKAAEADKQARLDPELERQFKETVSFVEEQRLAAAEQEVNTIFDKLGTKYPMADEESVISYAQALIANKKQETGKAYKPSESEYEQMFRSFNDRSLKRAEKHYSTKINAQKARNKEGGEAGSGGGIPGQAPRQFKTMKEATAALMDDPSF